MICLENRIGNWESAPVELIEKDGDLSAIPAKLGLEDGSVFHGFSFGAVGEVHGEVVFNTSMTGYQEILTDPSYCGQIVTMTYPEIGNYGINAEDIESNQLALRGFICREVCEFPSNYRSTGTLSDYLKTHGIIGLKGIDTRALVKILRTRGAMNGVLTTHEISDEALVEKARSAPQLVGQDYVKEVMPKGNSSWKECLNPLARLSDPNAEIVVDTLPKAETFHVVAVDYGMKFNIPRHLADAGCKVTVVPGTSSAQEILELNPDGVFLSNGPGDPRPLDYAIDAIKGVLGKKPVFGICLGQQLLGLALGGEIFKLKFGHRGANQPVLNKKTGRVEITSQNHGFAVDANSLPEGASVTHVNLNDQTVAGIEHQGLKAFGVQYHPESSAGPHDSRYLFEQFMDLMEANQGQPAH